MRNGEIITAGVLALLSVYLMYESSKNGFGYVQGRGPAGGFWPFWLSVGMLISTGFVALNWARRTSPPSRSEEPVLDAYGRKLFLLVGGGLVGFVALIDIISMYGAVAVFLIYYLRFLGRHGWGLTMTLALVSPIALFFFFEGLMRVSMPKGLGFTDPLFNVLYGVIY